jgi:hypothetical protein
VAPVLRALQGMDRYWPHGAEPAGRLRLAQADRRREFLRVRLNAAGGLELFGNQSSGVLNSAVWADGLVDNPPGQAIAAGDTVRFLPLAESDLAMKVQVRYFAALREALGASAKRGSARRADAGHAARRADGPRWRHMPRCWRAAARCAARSTRP